MTTTTAEDGRRAKRMPGPPVRLRPRGRGDVQVLRSESGIRTLAGRKKKNRLEFSLDGFNAAEWARSIM